VGGAKIAPPYKATRACFGYFGYPAVAFTSAICLS
jgi:hypothetical protein